MIPRQMFASLSLWWLLLTGHLSKCRAGRDSPLVILSHENYSSFLNENHLVLVEFSAPWCNHCRKMAHEYNNAANTLQELQSPGKLAVIDASLKENYGIVDMLKVEGFPSFLLYRFSLHLSAKVREIILFGRNGKHVLSYTGLRTESNFVEYMVQMSAPLYTKVNSTSEILKIFENIEQTGNDNVVENEQFFFVGMLSSSAVDTNNTLHAMNLVEEVSAQNSDKNVRFLFTESDEVMEFFSVPRESMDMFWVASVVLNNKNDVPTSDIKAILRSDIAKTSDFRKFVMATCSDTVLSFQSGNLHLIRSEFAPKSQVLVFCDDSDQSGKKCLDTVYNVSPAYRGLFLFVTVSSQEMHLYHMFGMKIGSPHPQIVILNTSDESQLKKYVLDDNSYAMMDLDKENPTELSDTYLKRFLDLYLENKLKIYYRSEGNDPNEKKVESESPIDESDTSQSELLPLRITSNTLRDKVIANTESVLLFITAPWCGHCKSLEPIIRSLARLLHQRKRKYEQSSAIPSLAGLPVSDQVVATKVDAGAKDDIIVAQIDGSSNDIHSLENINGEINICSGQKVGIEYTGERTVKDILQFIDKNGVPLTKDAESIDSQNVGSSEL